VPAVDVVILSAVRTPIGKYGGAFRDLHPAELGAVAARAAIERAGLQPADIDEVLIGHGRQAGSGPNPGRQVGRRARIPDASPAQTINKACASGLQAIASGAQSILLGESSIVLAGGIESMSRMPYLIDAIDARWGHRMGHFTLVDAMYRDGFQCPLSQMIMGETAEVLAREYAISRDAEERLLEARDARGRRLRITRLPMPGPLTVRAREAAGVIAREGSRARVAGERLAASYVNFYIANGGIVMPLLEARTDRVAAQRLKRLFPGRRLLGVPAREILLGGGNIHCITQQLPAGTRTRSPSAA